MAHHPRPVPAVILLFASLALGTSAGVGGEEAVMKPLQVHIVEPGPDRAAVGPTLFRVTVEAPGGRRVVRVILSVDGHVVGDLSQPPWQVIFDAGKTLHPHTLRAEVQDDSGAQASDLSTSLYISYVEQVEVVGAPAVRYAIQAGVMDNQRRPVRDLAAELFSLRLRGKPEQLISAAMDDRPLAVEILLDVSGTTVVYWPQIRDGANGFISQLEEEDGSEVMIFAGDVGRLVGFTHDHAYARGKVLTMSHVLDYPGFNPYGTHLYDALAAGIEEINVRPGQRSLVVLTDSQDFGSTISFEQVAGVIRRAGMRLDVVRFGRRPASGWSEATRMVKQLRNLAEDSGGMEWVVVDSEQIPGVFRTLANQLKSRYRLVFAPDLLPREQARQVPLKVKVARRGVRVLAPASLFSATEQQEVAPSQP
jgi:VWFA-related protein